MFRLRKRKQRTGYGHPVNKIPGVRNPGKGVKGNPLATSTLRGASVAQTNLRYKEVHLNEVYGCAYTPYLGYQKLRTESELELDYDDGFDFER